MCFLGKFAPEPLERDLCWLSGKPDGEPGSQCWGFPNGWLGNGTAAAAPATNGAPDGGASAPNGAAAPAPVPAPPSAAPGLLMPSTAALVLTALAALLAAA